jgi:hypothetical protein
VAHTIAPIATARTVNSAASRKTVTVVMERDDLLFDTRQSPCTVLHPLDAARRQRRHPLPGIPVERAAADVSLLFTFRSGTVRFAQQWASHQERLRDRPCDAAATRQTGANA